MITNSSKRIETTVNYGLDMFTPMRDHPFGVRDDGDMQQLIESIREYGVIVPILVRPNPRTDGPAYEIVSGHRRYEACRRLSIKDIPAIVRNMDDEEAIFAMVDANLHRERLLPSEKAFAYKMKLDAIKRQGERTQRVVIHYRFVGCLQIPDWYRKRKVTLESRQGVAVKYLPPMA